MRYLTELVESRAFKPLIDITIRWTRSSTPTQLKVSRTSLSLSAATHWMLSWSIVHTTATIADQPTARLEGCRSIRPAITSQGAGGFPVAPAAVDPHMPHVGGLGCVNRRLEPLHHVTSVRICVHGCPSRVTSQCDESDSPGAPRDRQLSPVLSARRFPASPWMVPEPSPLISHLGRPRELVCATPLTRDLPLAFAMGWSLAKAGLDPGLWQIIHRT